MAFVSPESIAYHPFVDHSGKPALNAYWPTSIRQTCYPSFQIYAAVDRPFISRPAGLQQAKYWCHSIINSLAASNFHKSYLGIRLELYDSIDVKSQPGYPSDTTRLQAFIRHAVAEREHRGAMVSLFAKRIEQKNLACRLKEMQRAHPQFSHLAALCSTKSEEIIELVRVVGGDIGEVKIMQVKVNDNNNDDNLMPRNVTPIRDRGPQSLSNLALKQDTCTDTTAMRTPISSRKRKHPVYEPDQDTNKKSCTERCLAGNKVSGPLSTDDGKMLRQPFTRADDGKTVHEDVFLIDNGQNHQLDMSTAVCGNEDYSDRRCKLLAQLPRLTTSFKPASNRFSINFKHGKSFQEQFLIPFLPLSFHCPRSQPYRMAIICITRPQVMASGVHVACFNSQPQHGDSLYQEHWDQDCSLARLSLRQDGTVRTSHGKKRNVLEKRKTLASKLQELMKGATTALVAADADIESSLGGYPPRQDQSIIDNEAILDNDQEVDHQLQEEFNGIEEATKLAESNWTYFF